MRFFHFAGVLMILLSFSSLCPGGELLRIVSEPTAGIISPRTYSVAVNTFPNEGLIFSIDVGIVPRFVAGIVYGGEYLTGLHDPVWNDHVRIRARFRFLDESLDLPGVAIGYTNLEEGPRTGSTYSRLSRGVYLVGSKNFDFHGDLAFHAGVNVSIEDSDHAGCWIGFDKSLPAGFGFSAEYDFATNEADSVRFDNGGGFMSMEIFWESFGQVRISMQFRDIFETGGQSYRALGVDFIGIY